MKFTTETTTVPARRVTVDLSVERAEALARAIDSNIVWDETDVTDELVALYSALMGEED